FKSLIKLFVPVKPKFAEHLKTRHKAMVTLTNFLRSGKLLNN
ncbi:unnamed protein product, partial [marine sediment metagenome]